MTNADDLYQQSRSSLERLGLREIPFTEGESLRGDAMPLASDMGM